MKLKLLFTSSLLLLAACGDDDGTAAAADAEPSLPTCEEDDRDETYVAGIAKTGPANYTITLMDADPAPPRKGDNTWTIAVADPDGNPVDGVQIELVGDMIDHGHGTIGLPPFTDGGDGSYVVGPLNLFMPGFWKVSVDVVDPGETEAADDNVSLDKVTFDFCLEG